MDGVELAGPSAFAAGWGGDGVWGVGAGEVGWKEKRSGELIFHHKEAKRTDKGKGWQVSKDIDHQ